ncbi:MAG: ABC transporter permease [Holophaga sp.]|nr:ABC transporter permease [Holophaga sp.]
MKTPQQGFGGLGSIPSFLEWFGELGCFVGKFVRSTFSRPFHFQALLQQMHEIGTRSLPLVVLASASTGVVLSLHTRESLVRFGAKGLLPVVIVMTIIKESGPIITALIVCGRVGAGIGAQLASMKVTEQIDAIEASGINAFRLLVVTRILACILMLPLLTIVADLSGILVGWLANTLVEHVSLVRFIQDGFKQLTFQDLLPTTFRTAIFGFIIGLLGCFQGTRSTGGTEGVARAATSAVVLASLFVIVADVGLVRLIQIVFRP